MDKVSQNNKDIAVRIDSVKKVYRLGQIGGGTLQADLQSWWSRKRGKEDPNTKIGQTERIIGQTFMALNGINLTIHQGERLGIIGGNGAGKSTLLKLLSRVTAPTEGKIELYGRVASMLEVGTGFNGEMTGRENIYMNGAILGMTKAEIDVKMEQIIEFSEVRDFIDTPVKRYSSGMYVKLAFSVAAHLDSEIMIMDEVLAVGDVAFQNKCLAKMRSVALDEGKTVLYVSHNMNTIRSLCERCIVLDQGRIVYDGDVEEAIQVYSRSKELNLKSKYDVKDIKRQTTLVSTFCRIDRIRVLSSAVSMNDTFRFELDIYSQKVMKECKLRCVITTAMGEIIGLTSSKFFSLHKGDNTVHFAFDTSLLAPDTYLIDINVVEHNGVGEYHKHDAVNQVLTFVVDESKFYYGMKWQKNFWGNVRINDIDVLM